VSGSGANAFLAPILARAERTPAALFAAFNDGEGWTEVTLGAFMDRARRFSLLLRESGLGPGDVVLIVLRHGPDAHAAFIGAMLLGAVPSFMPYPNFKQNEALYWRQHRHVFRHIAARAILACDDLVAPVGEAVAGNSTVVVPASRAGTVVPLELAPPPGDAVALLQHSSGTTGLKKGVALSYAAIAAQIDAYAGALDLAATPAPRIASWLPLYHDMGLVTSFLMPLWLGIPVLSIDPFAWTRRPALFLEAVETYRATHAWVPNFALLHQVRGARGGPAFRLDSLIALIACSEPCKPEAFDAFIARFAACGIRAQTLQTCYAMAETVFAVSQSQPGRAVRRLPVARADLRAGATVPPPAPSAETLELLSNGRPIAGCEVRILRDGAFAPERVLGEICIAAPWMFTGYHRNPEATAAAFHDGWLRSGDLGFLDGGEVFVAGRIKDVIIVNGRNVFAHDVEAAASRVPGVKPGRAVAFGHYVPAFGSEQLVVVAERLDDAANDAADGGGADDRATIAALNQAILDEVGVPCGDIRLVAQGWLTKTTSGKISRAENGLRYAAELRAT
jgi:fatty-acyl-CoA synthase